MSTLGKALLVALAWFVVFPVQAEVGVDWLSGQLQSNGSYALTTDIANADQSTAEALRTFTAYSVAPSGLAAAQQYISGLTYENTETLSRQIIAGVNARQNVSVAINQLLSYQDSSGGFGELVGYDPSVRDTSFALEALALAGQSGDAVLTAVHFLQQKQASDGSFGDGIADNGPSIDLTALAMKAMWYFRHAYGLGANVQNASTWLLAQRGSNNLWPETYQSAEALISIVPTLTDHSSIQSSVNSLQALQLSNGSFGNDVYVTALALRALQLAGSPTSNPDLASIQATVLDGQTSAPLSGVCVTLNGGACSPTGSDGRISFTGLSSPGQYQVAFSLAGYNSITTVTTSTNGGLIDLGTLQLTKPDNTGTATVKGIITAATTGQGLQGVAISVSTGGSAVTASDGSYQISSVPAGSVSVTASKSGYSSAGATANLSGGGVLIFSPTLSTQSQQGNIILRGIVTDGSTSQPLSGAAIMLSGANTASATSGSDGSYGFSGLSPGSGTISISDSGYDSVAATVDLVANSTTNYSPKLYPTGTTPADANSSSIIGAVVDSTTDQPLAGATVLLHDFGNHVYWRLYFTGAPNNIVDLTDVDFRATVGGSDEAVGGTATGDSQYDGTFPPSNAFDSDPNSRWATNSAAPPHWLMYQFAGPVAVQEYTLTSFANPVYAPSAWQLQYSDDGTHWALADARSSQSFAGAETKVFPVGIATTTDGSGNFSLTGIAQTSGNLAVSDSGYNATSLTVSLAPGAPTDVGKIRLRPLTAAQLLPDAQVLAVNSKSATTTDLSTLHVSGTLTVTLANTGAQDIPASRHVRLQAFSDINLDGAYEDGIDVPLGSAVYADDLPVNASKSTTISINGVLPFRDAPVSVFVDADEVVVETVESNNVGSSAYSCTVQPTSSTTPQIIPSQGYFVELVATQVTTQQGPNGLAVDSGGNLFIAQGDSGKLLKIPYGSHTPQEFGTYDSSDPDGVAVDKSDNVFSGGDIVTKYTPAGVVAWQNACPYNTQLMTTDNSGSLYVGTISPNICKFSSDGATATVLQGFDQPSDLTIGPDGFLYVAQYGPLNIVKANSTSGQILQIIKAGVAAASPVFGPDGNLYYGEGTSVYKLNLTSNVLSTVAGGFDQARGLAFGIDGSLYVGDASGTFTHKNIYRISTGPAPDLSASLFKLVDHGAQGVSLSVRVGNGGAVSSYNQVPVTFYEGDPASSGRVLGTVKIAAVPSGHYTDVHIDGVTGLSGTQMLYAVVDPANTVEECDKTNNSVSRSATPDVATGQLTVSTDATSYVANAPVALSSTATNGSSLSDTFSVTLQVEDVNGAVVVAFGPDSLGTLASGGSAPDNHSWNTGITRSGSYVLHGLLRDANNGLVAEARSSFNISGGNTVGALRVTTDRQSYNTTDQVKIDGLAQDLTSNASIPGAVLHLVVLSPSSQAVLTQDISLGEMAPGAVVERVVTQLLSSAAPGTYAAQGTLKDGTGNALASSSATFTVAEDVSRSIVGSVTVPSAPVNEGAAQSCTETVTNRGTLSQNVVVRHTLVRLDQTGTNPSTTDSLSLASGASQQLVRSIDTGPFEGGDYACALELSLGNAGWKGLGSAVFHVVPEPIALSTTVSVDRSGATYETSDSVSVTLTADSLMQHRTVHGATGHVTVTAPGGATVFGGDVTYGDLAAGSVKQQPATYTFTNAAEGDYSVSSQLIAEGHVIATDSTLYHVQKLFALTGKVTAAQQSVPRGQSQTCTDVLTNGSTLHTISGLQVRQTLLKTDVTPAQILSSTTQTVDVPASGTKSLTQPIDTASLIPGQNYACGLDAFIDNQWKTLDTVPFGVTSPQVSGSFAGGPRGRVLVLMDDQATRTGGGGLCDNGTVGIELEAVFDPPVTPNATVNVSLLSSGLVIDLASVVVGAFDGEVDGRLANQNVHLAIPYVSADDLVIKLTGNNTQHALGSNYNILVTVVDASRTLSFQTGLIDLSCRSLYSIGGALGNVFNIVGLGSPVAGTPFNPGIDEGGPGDGVDAATPAQQRAFLESVLQSEGWSYDVVTSPANFASKFRTGGYSAYALLSEYAVLSEQVQKELREAVYRGDGLLVAGRHDVRNHILDDVLGVSYKGHQVQPQGVQLLQSDIFTPANVYFRQTGSTQWVQRVRKLAATEVGTLISPTNTTTRTEVSENVYKKGKSVLAAFDLLAEADLAGAASQMADILKKPLTYIHPSQATSFSGRVAPVRFSLTNQGAATSGTATLSTSPILGSYIVATNVGTLANGKVTWNYSLAANETKTVDVWVSLPKGGVPATITAALPSGTYNGSVSYEIDPVALPGLDKAIIDLSAYVASLPTNLLGQLIDPIFGTPPAKKALDDLHAADADLTSGNVADALTQLTKAADELMHDSSSQIPAIRLEVDEAILEVGQLQ